MISTSHLSKIYEPQAVPGGERWKVLTWLGLSSQQPGKSIGYALLWPLFLFVFIYCIRGLTIIGTKTYAKGAVVIVWVPEWPHTTIGDWPARRYP